MIYSKPEFIIMYNSEIEQMIKANASGCGYICMVTGR